MAIVADWNLDDREHDWLAQEMEREGYVANKSGLAKAHALEEHSRDWNAGAKSNAKEHYDRHQAAQQGRIISQAGKGPEKQISKIATFVFLIIFISAVQQFVPRYYFRLYPVLNYVSIGLIVLFVLGIILNIIGLLSSLSKGGRR